MTQEANDTFRELFAMQRYELCRDIISNKCWDAEEEKQGKEVRDMTKKEKKAFHEAHALRLEDILVAAQNVKYTKGASKLQEYLRLEYGMFGGGS